MGSKQLHRLNALKVSREIAPGYYADGGGLYLQISKSGSRSWIFRFSLGRRGREMGLGSLSVISLAEARAQASSCRKMLAVRIDPIEARNTERQLAATAPHAKTFKEAAEDFIETHRGSWKNKKHAQQWENTLATYAYPTIGKMDVALIDTPMVVRILQSIWTKKPETASRVRGRIESVLDAAKALGLRGGENPARWRGHLEQILPKRNRARRVKHHPALPFADLPEFMRELAQRPATAARALHLLILVAGRTSEILLAKAEEFDMKKRVWAVPAARMKMGVEHRIPLPAAAVALVQKAIDNAPPGAYLFPGKSPYKPLSNMAMLNLLDRMGHVDITVHGFRSTFRDWAAECTEYADSLAEMALAHAVENKVEGAYRRGDMLERRRKMMEEWSRFCDGQAATVMEITPPQAQSAA